MVKDVLTVQAKEREKHAQAEKEISAMVEVREKFAEDQEQKFMDSMTNMMSVIMQFMGTMMYGVPPVAPTYPGAFTPMNAPPPPAPLPMSMYYTGPSTPDTSSASIPPAPTQESDDDED